MKVEVPGVLIYDFDGVCIDSCNADYLERLMDALDRGGLYVRDDLVLKLKSGIYLPLQNLFEEHLGLHKDDVSRVVHKYREREESITYSLIPNTEDVLELGKKLGYKLAVLSNRNVESLTSILDYSGLGIFDYISSSNNRKFNKPDRRAYVEVLEYFEKIYAIPANNCYYFEDVPINVIGARNCGIKTAGVTTGLHTKEDMIEAGVDEEDIIGSISETFDWLARRGY